MAEMVLIRGLPGSGKTTKGWTLKNTGIVDFVIAADDWFEDANRKYNFNPKFLPEAHAWCRSSTAKCILEGYRVAVCNTFTKIDEMVPYFNLAVKLGCKVRVIEMKTQYGSVHNVPEDKMKQMAARWEEFAGCCGEFELPVEIIK
jgi:tRNA uridine 5-carbamoylmethylation protein Kti12